MFVLMVICVVFLLLLAALGCLLHLFRFPNRTFADVIPYLRRNQEAEMEDLLDPMKEENLLDRGHKRSRKEQLKRIHLANEVMTQRAHNARVFQEWGYTESERAAGSLNSESGERAQALVDACLHYRLNTCLVRAGLCCWYLRMVVLPFIHVPRISSLGRNRFFNVMESYTSVEQAAANLALACGEECRHQLVRTLGIMRDGTPGAAWSGAAGRL